MKSFDIQYENGERSTLTAAKLKKVCEAGLITDKCKVRLHGTTEWKSANLLKGVSVQKSQTPPISLIPETVNAGFERNHETTARNERPAPFAIWAIVLLAIGGIAFSWSYMTFLREDREENVLFTADELEQQYLSHKKNQEWQRNKIDHLDTFEEWVEDEYAGSDKVYYNGKDLIHVKDLRAERRKEWAGALRVTVAIVFVLLVGFGFAVGSSGGLGKAVVAGHIAGKGGLDKVFLGDD